MIYCAYYRKVVTPIRQIVTSGYYLIKLIKKDGSTYLRTSQVAIILFIEKDLKSHPDASCLVIMAGTYQKQNLWECKFLCWETIVEKLEKSSLWRADLMTDKTWSLRIKLNTI